jgi:hypothetical protein
MTVSQWIPQSLVLGGVSITTPDAVGIVIELNGKLTEEKSSNKANIKETNRV